MSGKILIWKWKIPNGFDKDRADRVILRAWEAGEGEWKTGQEGDVRPMLTRSQLQRYIEQGKVLADSRIIKASMVLSTGVVVTVEFPPPEPTEILPEDRPISILYEDEHLLVINKPQGLTVHPSGKQRTGTLVNALLHHIKDLSGIGGKLRPGIVHRLDKDTSGALLITKTDAAHQALSKDFAAHRIERIYWALCYGAMKTQRGELESTIGRNPTDRKKMALNVRGGRRAVSHFETQETYGPSLRPFASGIQARLETGRTHQVRVHLTSLGCALLGDPVYGVPTSRSPKWLALPEEIRITVASLRGQALHAKVLGFTHPFTQKSLRFEASPPEAFLRLLNQLRLYFSPKMT